MKINSKESVTRNPIFKKIDMSEVETWDGSKEAYKELIIEKIKKLGIYSDSLIYRGFDADRMSEVVKHGTDIPDQDVIWGSREGELIDSPDEESALDYALDSNGLSIYDGGKLDCVDDMHEFKPKNGLDFKDALLAGFELI